MRPAFALLTLVGLSIPVSVMAADDAAQHETRLWKDASGSFQVRARLLDKTGDTVRLQKADGKEVSVPLSKLSPADRDYVEKVTSPRQAADGTEQAPPPPRRGLRLLEPSISVGDGAALPEDGPTIDSASAPVEGRFDPDPADPAPAADPGTVSVCPTDAYDKISMPKPVDAGCRKLLVSVGRHVITEPNAARGRIFLVDWAERRAEMVWEVPKKLELLDLDPDSGRSVHIEGMDGLGRGGEIVMAEGIATGEGKVLFRRTLPGAGKPGFQPTVSWGRLISSSHLLALFERHVVLWDLPAARVVWRLEAPTDTPPAVSPSGLALAVSLPSGVAVVETATGKVLRRFEEAGLNRALAFDPTGSRLAVSEDNRFRVWDLAADVVVAEGITTEHLGSSKLTWVGPRTLLAAFGQAIDTELGMAVWKYALPPGDSLSAAGRVWYAGGSLGCEVSALEIPHLPVGYVVGAILAGGEGSLVVGPGSAVSIAVDNRLGPMVSIDEAAIRDAIAEACRNAGWVVKAGAPIGLVARLERGEVQELKFRDHRNADSISTATMQPFKAALEIRRGNDPLWTRETQNHPPFMLFLGKDETVQQALTKFERPDPDFFSRLHLPPRIPRTDGPYQPGFSILSDGKWSDSAQVAPGAARPGTRPR
jgi:hypothetical protein